LHEIKDFGNPQGRTIRKITVDFNQSFVGNKRLEFLGSPQGRGIRKIKDFDAVAKILTVLPKRVARIFGVTGDCRQKHNPQSANADSSFPKEP